MAPPTPPWPKAGSPAGPGAPSRPASSGSSTTATSSPGPKAPTAQEGRLRTSGSGAGQGSSPTRSPLWRIPPTPMPSRQRRRSAPPGKPGPLPGRAVPQKARPARNPCWQGRPPICRHRRKGCRRQLPGRGPGRVQLCQVARRPAGRRGGARRSEGRIRRKARGGRLDRCARSGRGPGGRRRLRSSEPHPLDAPGRNRRLLARRAGQGHD